MGEEDTRTHDSIFEEGRAQGYAHAITDAIATVEEHGTHLALLTLALLRINKPGSIVEVGIGMFSTPVLSAFAATDTDRTFHSYETSQDWLNKYQAMFKSDHKNHRFHLIKPGFVTLPDNTALVFIDGIAKDRAQWVKACHKKGAVIVVHDTEYTRDDCPGIHEALDLYKNRLDWDTQLPWTTIAWEDDSDITIDANARQT